MYKNVGKKIQLFAKIFAWIGIIAFLLIGALCVLYGIYENSMYFANGVIILLFGPLGVYISSLTLVGFGKLIEDNQAMRNDINDIKNKKGEEQ